MRFPEFYEEWDKSIIENHFDLYSGNTPSRLDKENFIGDVNWITSGELKEHYIGDTKEHISETVANENNLKVLPVGTFVIAIYGLEAEGVRGTGSITTRKSTISQACMAFTPIGKISNEFLYSWYKKHGNVIGTKYAQGTKQQNLSYDIIAKFPIHYPSKQEQEKLNKFITLLDNRISTQSRAIEKLQSLMEGLMKAHYKKSPKTIVRIKELGEYFTVMNLSKNDLDDIGIPCVLYGELFTTYHCTISKVKSKTSVSTGLTLSQNNDLLFPSSTTVDAVSLIAPSAITVEGVVLGGDMFGIHINENQNNVYLSFLFNYILKWKLAQYAQGSTIIHLHYNDIQNVRIEVPSLKSQLQFVELAMKLQQKIEYENRMLTDLHVLKTYLLQHMFI